MATLPLLSCRKAAASIAVGEDEGQEDEKKADVGADAADEVDEAHLAHADKDEGCEVC